MGVDLIMVADSIESNLNAKFAHTADYCSIVTYLL